MFFCKILTEAPVAFEYVPVSHCVQELAAALSEYVPLEQSLQSLLPLLQVPRLPVQLVSPPVPNLKNVATGHAWQSAELLLALWSRYFPASHTVHSATPSASLYVPLGQWVQAFLSLLPTLPRNVPTGHSPHSEAPAVNENLPV